MNDYSENPAVDTFRASSPRSNLPVLRTGGTIMPLIPRTQDEIERIAATAFRSGLVQRDIKSVDAACMIIMHGMEIGLPPMASLERIAVINGRRCVWGDAVPALAMDTNELVEWDEGWTGTGDEFEAYCAVSRKRNGIVFRKRATFSVAEAKQAGLWDEREKVNRWVYKKGGRQGEGQWKEVANDSPWFRYKKRMLQMRARVAFRDLFSDRFLGLFIAEEMIGGETEMRDVTPMAPTVIHNPLQDDADLEQGNAPKLPERGITAVDNEAERAFVRLGPEATDIDAGIPIHEAGTETEVMQPDGPTMAQSTREPDTSPPGASQERLRPGGGQKPVDHDPVTGEVFDARVDSERRDAEDPPEPTEPPRQARRKPAGEPKPEPASKQPESEKASPGPNPALAIALEQPWIKRTVADYMDYLERWVEAWTKWGQDPIGLRDRFSAERTIRNGLAEKMTDKQLAQCKATAAGAFARLGGVPK